MFCKILKHHSWEPEVEVTHSLIVLFILLRIGPIEVGIEAISLRPQCRYDTIRYDTILFTSRVYRPQPRRSTSSFVAVTLLVDGGVELNTAASPVRHSLLNAPVTVVSKAAHVQDVIADSRLDVRDFSTPPQGGGLTPPTFLRTPPTNLIW